MKNFSDLDEREVLALAIALEEEDCRTYDSYAEALHAHYPGTAVMFREMAKEEDGHRHRLLEHYRRKFGEHLPLIRRQDVKGFVQRKAVWLSRPLSLETVRAQIELMEVESRRFYARAAERATDATLRQLLGDLAAEERRHEARAETLEAEYVPPGVSRKEHASERRLFLLQVVQPGLVGLMDGSVSTLAPIFAAALSTGSTWAAFLVGLAAALGAGISMGLAEALSDNGSLTGRGSPWWRGLVCGGMTTLGGLGHTLPFLIADFHSAMTLAVAVVLLELAAIAWVRHRYMESPLATTLVQVVIGGALVFLTGVLIGGA